MRVGMLTGGGDCPGLNAVIRAVVRKGEVTYGDEFVGFLDGWQGVMDSRSIQLDVERCRGILPRGGTILGTSRTNPYKLDGGVARCLATLRSERIDALIAIGGDDTLGVAHRLSGEGVAVIGVPKTIDNDVGDGEFRLNLAKVDEPRRYRDVQSAFDALRNEMDYWGPITCATERRPAR